jgi:hypothetical protein
MNKQISAVITGDVVASTSLKKDHKQILLNISDQLLEYDPAFRMEIFRGDSFQALVNDPLQGFYLMMAMKAGLRQFEGNSTSIEDIIDARMSLGVGVVNDPLQETKLGEMDGEAFVRSGRGLEKMKNDHTYISIHTGDQSLDEDFQNLCPILDTLIRRWSTLQSQAIFLYLLKNTTQATLAQLLNLSQRGVSKRLEASGINQVMKFDNYYQKQIRWKFHI